jgi:hypothetical protein
MVRDLSAYYESMANNPRLHGLGGWGINSHTSYTLLKWYYI